MADDAIDRPADDQADLERRLTRATGSLPPDWTLVGPPYRFYGDRSGLAYIYGPAGSDAPTIMAGESPHIVVYLYLSGPYVSAPMPAPVKRATVYRHRSHDVMIEAPQALDEDHFQGFVSAVTGTPR